MKKEKVEEEEEEGGEEEESEESPEVVEIKEILAGEDDAPFEEEGGTPSQMINFTPAKVSLEDTFQQDFGQLEDIVPQGREEEDEEKKAVSYHVNAGDSGLKYETISKENLYQTPDVAFTDSFSKEDTLERRERSKHLDYTNFDEERKAPAHQKYVQKDYD